jgi:DNA (cytosine-5)-methyltransferase 1
MRYLSVCSGIEAATVAWHNLGWEPAGFSEIEKFPSQVLNHHYPEVKNFGDMTKFEEWNLDSVGLLVGGTPCQSFSVAGLRKGLDDPRGNLMLTYGAIAKRFRPKWLVWENVPGVLSSNGGRDFGTFLGMLGELGYGFAYRVLDAQYFGVAQRRRRVFVVGCLGNWRTAAAVLFERDSLCGNPTPSREKGKNFADNVGKCLTARGAGGGNCDPETSNLIPDVFPTLLSSMAGISRTGNAVTEHETYIPVVQPIPIDTMNHIGRSDFHSFGGFEPGAPSYTLTKGHSHAVAQPIPYDLHQVTAPVNRQSREPGDPCHTLAKQNAHNAGIVQPMAVHENQRAELRLNDMVGAITCAGGKPGQGYPTALINMAVRRLTPVECERLQGFPDNYTNIKENCPDGPRYKALGNSMAVPVMQWIGKRIQAVEEL